MKKSILIILSLLSIFSYTRAQDFWEIVDPHKNVRAVDMSQNGILYISGTDTLNQQVGVFKSSDGGDNWEWIWESPFDYAPTAIHSNENIVYLATQGNLIRSENQGQTWDTVYPENGRSINNINTYQNQLFIGSKVVCRTINNGQTWDTIFNPEQNEEYIYDMLHLSPDTMLVATINWVGPGGIYRSTNGGETWDWVLEGCWKTSLEKTTDGVLFSGGYNCDQVPYHQVHASYDSGETWEEVYSLFLLQVQDMAITPNNVIYFGAIQGYAGINGMYRSFDYGDTWNQVESDIITPSSEVYEVEALPDGRMYVCANRNEPGVPGIENLHRTTDPLYTNVSEGKKTQKASLSVRPNPASEQATFKRSSSNKAAILNFYDVNGTLISQARFNKGQKQLRINVSDWSGGIYLARIVNQGNALVKFMVR